jgi:hypothetical protein
MILATHGIVGSSIVQFAFDADYQAVLDYGTTQGYTLPSASQQLLQNQLVVDLKDGGIWSKLDTFSVFATDGDSDFALIDWIRLTQYTAVNSPTFTTNEGFSGNGTSSYIETNFIPSINGVNYTLNNASRMAWVTGTGTTAIDGHGSAGNRSIKNNSNNHQINSINNLNTVLDNTADGYHAINRTSLTNVELFIGTTQNSRTQTSTLLPITEQFILRNQTNYSTNKIWVYGMGASLVSENTDFYNALNTYLTSL